MNIRTLITSLILATGVFSAMAGPVMLEAKLDSASMLMGTLNTLHLEVVQDKGTKGNFPLFEKYGPEGIVTLLNDTIEIGRPMKVDTVEVGSGRIQINYQLPVQVFDSGVYRLPEFVYASGRDTARSKELLLSVVPVNVTANDSISPLTDVVDAENPSVFDKVPDPIYNYWWAFLLGILIIAAGVYAWFKYKKDGTILPSKPEIPPYEQAISALRQLKAKKLWESGRDKDYYTELTDILRRYLDRRFGIKAMEMTSSEILSHLADLGNRDVPRDKIRDILDMADFVKFAMVRPLPDDNVALYKNALDFVESTRPVERETDSPELPEGKNNTPAKKSTESEILEDTTNLGLRGRRKRKDDSAERISGPRMKVGKHTKKGINPDKEGKEVRK